MEERVNDKGGPRQRKLPPDIFPELEGLGVDANEGDRYFEDPLTEIQEQHRRKVIPSGPYLISLVAPGAARVRRRGYQHSRLEEGSNETQLPEDTNEDPNKKRTRIEGRRGTSDASTFGRQLDQQYEALARLLPNLIKTHGGEYVAIAGGKVVDQDRDRAALLKRIREKIGDDKEAVLIEQILEGPQEEESILVSPYLSE